MPKHPIVQDCVHAPSIHSIIREVLHTLGNIDFKNEFGLDRVDKGVPDEALKRYIKQHIRAAHQRKRQPYVDLRHELRMQRTHPSFAA
ncbi:hypothetical protein [Microvirga calopogonii]|uniref:hypothetical protein n=1 Tax=Microvirga calopogonii TaxID=2078013 RepID=UPI0013B46248|nr:hypothetical protein [Microvirga calopogonii]